MSNTTENFQSLNLKPELLRALESVGYEAPSPIQSACIPLLISGHDLIGQAQTGTGKTAAFALPLLHHLDLEERQTQILVLTPTRELAIQVAEAFQTYAKFLPGFNILPVYGGQGMGLQLKQLQRGVHVVVGTPGRVMDHLERKSLKLNNLKAVVLDEGDEMLRMGFIDDVEWILQHTPSDRQTALFSATMPEAIRRVASKYLKDPKEIKIKSATATAVNIKQRYWMGNSNAKLDALTRILELEPELDATIIFVRTKTETVSLVEKLGARGYAANALNGDLTQSLRERIIEQLKSGKIDIVVATDVAARGLDVPRISHVINYDIPNDTEAYIHRIGRTGRAGRAGDAILFVSPRETRMLKAIEKATKQIIEPMSTPSKQEVSNRRIQQFRQQVLNVFNEQELDYFRGVVNQLMQEDNLSAKDLAAALVYLAQKDKPLVQIEEVYVEDKSNFSDNPRPARRSGRGENSGRGDYPTKDSGEKRVSKKRSEGVSEGFKVYQIAIGKSQMVTPRDIVGAIANEANIPSRLIGSIKLGDESSTIELSNEVSAATLSRIQKLRIKQFPIGLQTKQESKPRKK